ncbi:MAG: efflux transporter outer membrane subunit, partial [Myxococcota bacterium]|nr:efflux transporter outer membrane subunit [Myxococcota bacterium]
TVAILGAACSPYGAVRDPLPPTVELPAAWTAGGEREGTQESAAPDRWWVAFGDPQMTEAVEVAVVENFQLRAAWARVRQADTLGAQASSQWWPQISAQIEASRRQSVIVLPDFTGMGGAPTARQIENNGFSISLPVSYEIDLWDRIGSQSRAAGMDMMAARDDVDGLAITIASNVVEAWLNVVYQRQLRALLETQVATSAAYLELQELRFTEGLGSALDVFQQRAQVEGLRAQLAATRAQEEIAEQQIAVLLGRVPGASIVPPSRIEIPAPPPGPARGIPSELLIRRPDVRAARHRIEAADQRVAAAIADRFPRFNLSAAFGFSSPNIELLFESFVYSLVAGLIAPLFDGERREAVVQQNHAIVWERTEQLAQTLLTAVQEVEAALVQERYQQEQIEALELRVVAAGAALEEARQRYAAGILEGYLQVLTALSVVQQAEQALLQSRRQLLSYRIQLHRALGGSWTTALEMPEPHRPVAEEHDE